MIRFNFISVASTLIIVLLFLPGTSTMKAHRIPESPRSREAVHRCSEPLRQHCIKHDVKLGDHLFIRIFKEEHIMEIWLRNARGYTLVQEYLIASYSGYLGPKIQQGDRQAPEGFYYFRADSMNPWSSYHLSFNIGYPNQYDRYHNRTGGLIMVHGSTVSIGCFAMTDPVIEAVYTYCQKAFENGQGFIRVHVFPFRMTLANLEEHRESKWYTFWLNLKEGYDFFEKNGVEPDVSVREGRYVYAFPDNVN